MSIQRASPSLVIAGKSFSQTPSLQLVYKHSPDCGFSRHALTVVSAFADAHPDMPVILVDVINQRAHSERLAADLRVTHASPQVIFVRDGRADWSESHGRISLETLERALADLTQIVVRDDKARSA